MARTLEKSSSKESLKQFEDLGLDQKALAACLAVSPKTIERWRTGSVEPNEGGLRVLEKLEEIYRMAMRLFKREKCQAWFRTPNPTLGGARPLDVLSRGDLDQVRNLLGMLQWGIYS